MFYAITGLGWGRGDSLMVAVEEYLKAQRRSFPHLSQDELEEAWGFVWLAPEGATGFFDGVQGFYWKMGDADSVLFEQSQKVAPIGKLPESVWDHWQSRQIGATP